jgi:hypothetical protein
VSYFLTGVTATAVHAGTEQQLQAVVRQQPLPAYQALELAVRGSPLAQRQQCARLLLSTLELFYAVERSGKTVVRGSEQHVLPINLQFSLPSSCVNMASTLMQAKSSAPASSSSSSSNAADAFAQLAACSSAVSRAMLIAIQGHVELAEQQQQLAGQPAAVADNATVGCSTQCQAFMLMARCFTAAGHSLSAIAASSAASLDVPQGGATAAGAAAEQACRSGMLAALRACMAGAEVVLSQLPAAVLPGAAESQERQQQQLMRDLRRLRQQLTTALEALSSTDAAADVGTADANSRRGSSSSVVVSQLQEVTTQLLPGLCERLVACGVSLAALCPVPLCCNNPGCVELHGASEQQLVAGKGSVCSRCRWVMTRILCVSACIGCCQGSCCFMKSHTRGAHSQCHTV